MVVGAFFEPTALVGVDPGMRVKQEEREDGREVSIYGLQVGSEGPDRHLQRIEDE